MAGILAVPGFPLHAASASPTSAAALAPPRVHAAAAPLSRLPRLIFVSRHPAGRDVVPGLGPRGRTAAPGGRLMVRERDGRVHPLLPPGLVWDASDPSVSYDGRTIAFAGTAAPESAWRIFRVDADGRHLMALTRSDRTLDLAAFGPAAARFERYDDFDPAWLPDGRVCFASTRWPLNAAVADVPASNLFVVDAAGGAPKRITSERNGAEEPAVDPATGRIVYARWWANPYLASDLGPGGITTDAAQALPAERVNLWTAASITPSGDGLRLAAGDPLDRAGETAYQPAPRRGGGVIAVRGDEPQLAGPSGRLSLQVLSAAGRSRALPLGGKGARRGGACAPAELPDGRILFSHDLLRDGDYGLAVLDPSSGAIEEIVDLPGTLELDAAVLAPRRRPPVLPAGLPPADSDRPPMTLEELRDPARTFRFDCLNVFANADVDARVPDAPPIARGARIRFFAVLPRPAGGDTAVLVREAPIDPSGAVHQHDLPADVPLFEQVVDAGGHLLMSAHGPAHVPGMNFGRAGASVQCVGCHVGHSTQRVPRNYAAGAWFNASPSADVRASSEAPGTVGARALVDRKTRGPLERVAWIAGDPDGARARLAWKQPIEVGALVLYGARDAAGADLHVAGCDVTFFLGGREVSTLAVKRPLSPSGTRIECGGVVADAIELTPATAGRTLRGRAVVALAEVETVARLVP